MKFGYTVVFVPDVAAAVAFYETAFGLAPKMATPVFAMLETGATTLAFGFEENERRELSQGGSALEFRSNRPEAEPAGIQLSFVAPDVDAAYARAIAAGAGPVYPPRQMPWGQWVSRVRDLNGVLVSIVSAPTF